MWQEQDKEKVSRGFNYLDQAVVRLLLTNAIPLLFDVETFVCYISILDQYVPFIQPGGPRFP